MSQPGVQEGPARETDGRGPPFAGPVTEESERERVRVASGELPERYGEPWGLPFYEAAQSELRPGIRILDVGSGRRPSLPPANRPAGCEYVGLDISAAELATASDAYDATVVCDITSRLPEFEGAFDLVLSWQALEHVRSMELALENIRSYLRPGGRMVAQISGSFALFALLARVIPHRVASRMMTRLLGVDPEEKFPARYDQCHPSALEPLLSTWSSYEIVPRYKGGAYFAFFRPLERAYLAYEGWAERSGRRSLATHYVIQADK